MPVLSEAPPQSIIANVFLRGCRENGCAMCGDELEVTPSMLSAGLTELQLSVDAPSQRVSEVSAAVLARVYTAMAAARCPSRAAGDSSTALAKPRPRPYLLRKLSVMTKSDSDKREDDVLKRMLKTPPKPHSKSKRKQPKAKPQKLATKLRK